MFWHRELHVHMQQHAECNRIDCRGETLLIIVAHFQRLYNVTPTDNNKADPHMTCPVPTHSTDIGRLYGLLFNIIQYLHTEELLHSTLRFHPEWCRLWTQTHGFWWILHHMWKERSSPTRSVPHTAGHWQGCRGRGIHSDQMLARKIKLVSVFFSVVVF